MTILILGFDNVEEIDAVMQPIIEQSQCFLFNVIVNGGRGVDDIGPSELWALKVGAPKIYINDPDPQTMIKKMESQADYLVLKMTNRTPQWQKNLLMRMKNAGKHGSVIKDE